MSGNQYYFNEDIEDVELRKVAERTKELFKYFDNVNKAYQQHNDSISNNYFQDALFIMSMKSPLFFLPSPVHSRSSPQHSTVSSSPGASNQTSYAMLERNPKVSSTPQKYLQFDSANNVVSTNVNTSTEEQSTPKIIRSASNKKTEAQEQLPVDNTDNFAEIEIRRKQPNPLKVIELDMNQAELTPGIQTEHFTKVEAIENATEPLNSPSQHFSFPHKQVDNVEAVNLQANTTVTSQNVSINPKQVDRATSSEVDRNYISSIDESVKTPRNQETEKRKSGEITEMHAIFPVHGKVNAIPGERVKSVDVPTNETESIQGNAKAENQFPKFANPNEETLRTANLGKLQVEYVTPMKIAKMPDYPATNVKNHISSSEEAQVVVCSDQDSKSNVNPNQSGKVNEIFEAKRKTPSSRIAQFRFDPRIMQSTRIVEIEKDASCEIIEEHSPVTLPIPMIKYILSPENIEQKTENIDKKGSFEDIHSPIASAKASSSRDFCSPAKCTATSFPIVAKANNPSKSDFSLEKFRLSREDSKGSTPTKSSLETATSPINNSQLHDCKRVTDGKDEKISPKDKRFCIDDSKAECSRDFFSSPKSALASSPIVAKTNSPSRGDFNLGKVSLFSAFSISPPTKSSLETASSPANNMEPGIIGDCIMRFYKMLQLRNDYLCKFCNSLLSFKKCLKFLCTFTSNILSSVQFTIVCKDCDSKETQECISQLTSIAAILTRKINWWKMEVDLEIRRCSKFLQQIHRIKTILETFGADDQHITNDLLRGYEKELKGKGENIKDMISVAESRRLSFLSTSVHMQDLIHRYVKYHVHLGILKFDPVPTI